MATSCSPPPRSSSPCRSRCRTPWRWPRCGRRPRARWPSARSRLVRRDGVSGILGLRTPTPRSFPRGRTEIGDARRVLRSRTDSSRRGRRRKARSIGISRRLRRWLATLANARPTAEASVAARGVITCSATTTSRTSSRSSHAGHLSSPSGAGDRAHGQRLSPRPAAARPSTPSRRPRRGSRPTPRPIRRHGRVATWMPNFVERSSTTGRARKSARVARCARTATASRDHRRLPRRPRTTSSTTRS